jgi:C-terminal processing protease CtpA/Prc
MRAIVGKILIGAAFVTSSLFAELTVDERIEDFNYFWNAYKDAYVFFDLKAKDHGVDWDSAYENYISRLESSSSDKDLYRAVTEAQVLLRDGHCYNESLNKIHETEVVYIQKIKFGVAEGKKIVVKTVEQNTAFHEAGIKRGYELVSLDGKTIRQLAKEARDLMPASSPGQFWFNFAFQLYIYNPLKGKPKSRKSEWVFKDYDGNLVAVKEVWHGIPATGRGDMVNSFVDVERGVGLNDAEKARITGPLPMDVRIFNDLDIAYVKIDSWMKEEDPIEQFEQVFSKIKDTKGLILDFRGNGGGVGAWGVLFSNYLIGDKAFSDKTPNHSYFERNLSRTFFRARFSKAVPEMIEYIMTDPWMMWRVIKAAFKLDIPKEELMVSYRDGEFKNLYINIVLNDRVNKIKTYDKPVYVLMDGGCYSTTDICLSILNEYNRVKIYGTPNGAGSGSPIPFVLPNSGLLVYVPHARAFPPYGHMIEGRPLKPDVIVSPKLEDIAKGKDTILSVAVADLAQEIMPLAHFSNQELSLEGETAYNSIGDKEEKWHEFPTPDWAIDAKLRHIEDSMINLDK